MRRLRKADVTALLDTFDRDPVGALSVAITRILEVGELPWAELVVLANLPVDATAALLRGDQSALDRLARDLNELRALPH